MGHRRIMQGCPLPTLASKTGISVARLEQLEALPSYVTVTKSEAAQIAKVLGSGDIHRPLTPDAAMEERVRLA
jgi:hypothetical protein